MSLTGIVSVYLNLNILILVAFAGLNGLSLLFRKFRCSLPVGDELKLHYSVLAIVLISSVGQPLLPRTEFFSPPIKVWSPSSSPSLDSAVSKTSGLVKIPLGPESLEIETSSLLNYWAAFGVLLFLFGGVFFVRDMLRLQLFKRKSFLVRKIGRVRILLNDRVQVPFSFWWPSGAYVVVPSSLIFDGSNHRIAVLHELQHHRQKDTLWIYAIWILRLICLVNPIIHIWSRTLSEIQEFTCDQTLIQKRKVQVKDYARCLLQVAETAINHKQRPVCATGLTFANERKLLKRRIESMFVESNTQVGKVLKWMSGLCLLSLLGVGAFASNGLIQDRRVSMVQAQAMAAKASGQSDLKVVVNDLVLAQLNRYIGTPEGREFMRKALIRMENHRDTVLHGLQKYGVPAEVLALPLIESGYQNLPESKNSAWPTWKAAGVWQFVRQTARAYGLVVNDQRDERMNVQLETDAAMRYLMANNLRFKDWHLAVLAYNMGENAVQKAIDQVGQRDAWALIRAGHEGDQGYLAKFMAAILIMRNPESVQ